MSCVGLLRVVLHAFLPILCFSFPHVYFVLTRPSTLARVRLAGGSSFFTTFRGVSLTAAAGDALFSGTLSCARGLTPPTIVARRRLG